MKICVDTFSSRIIDQYTIDNDSINSIDLMEKAGNKIYEYLINNFDKNKTFIVLEGSGNNAGDGYVLSRLLFQNGYKVFVYKVNEPKSNECIINHNLYKGNFINELIEGKDIIYIDAILGIGLNKDIEAESNIYKCIENVNQLKGTKISIDIPSGLNATTGRIMGITFNADITLSIGYYKLGLFLLDGKDVSKKNIPLDIGFKLPSNLINIEILEKNDYKDLLFSRKENSNKGSYGKVGLIGGNSSTFGALKLSSLSYLALHLNVGYSYVIYPSKINKIIEESIPELIYLPLSSNKKGFIKFKKKEIMKLLDFRTVSIGMGCGVSKNIYKIIKYLFKNYSGNLIIDADGLNSISKYGVDLLLNHKCNVILTPHMKEFSRLSNLDVKEIQDDRVRIIKEFSFKYKVITILKDNSTLISDGKHIYLNVNGNSNLSKGGSGDILSGLLLGVVNDNNLLKSCAFGSYILGRSSDILKEYKEGFEVVGQNIIDTILKAYKEVEHE